MTKIIIPGKPQPKQRPRVTIHGTYTPQETLAYEELVRICTHAKEFYGQGIPLQMEIYSYFEIPKSWSNKRKQMAAEGKIYPVCRPDVDNLEKIIADSLNGYLYHDDAQIVDAVIHKRYSDEPRVEVTIKPIEEVS